MNLVLERLAIAVQCSRCEVRRVRFGYVTTKEKRPAFPQAAWALVVRAEIEPTTNQRIMSPLLYVLKYLIFTGFA